MSERKQSLSSRSNASRRSNKIELPRKDFCLYYEIQRRRWLQCKTILERSDASRYVHYSPKILFYACIYNAPVEIVKCIYHVDPSQICYQNDAVEMILGDDEDTKVSSGHTPLLWALNQYNYRAVKQIALRNIKCKDGGNADQVLHFLLQIVTSTEYGARSVKIPGKDGSLPLHVASIINLPQSRKKIIRKLLEAYPDAIDVKANGKTPFLLKCLDLKYVAKLCNFKFQEYNPGMSMTRFNDEEWSLAKDILLLFIEVLAFRRLSKDGLCFPVHTAFSIENLPLIVMLLLMDMFPEELHRKDENGNYPIHIVLSYSNFLLDESISNYDKHLKMMIFDKIYQSSKNEIRIPNRNGCTPLFLAIRNGYPFEHQLVQQLLRDNPECIAKSYIDRSSPDGILRRGLYLFMEAAISDKASLSALYELIKLNPSLFRV